MLQIDKDTLKNLIYEEIKAFILECNPDAFKTENFQYEFSENKEYINLTCITEVIYGNDCWGSEEERRFTSLNKVGYYEIENIIKNFVIDESELKMYNITKDDDIYDYYQNYDIEFYTHNNKERINEDCYGNHEIIKTISVPIEEITLSLLVCKYTKPLEVLLNSFEYLDNAKELYVQLEVERLDQKLDKKEQSNKVKVKL